MKHISSSTPEATEISLRLEQYDDIFSDFDIRSYASRALSVDFLDEIKRASYDKKEGGIELALHVPKRKRDESHETVIQERLAAHFKKHYHLLLEEKRRIIKVGMCMILMGIFCMIAATLVVFEDPSENIFLSFLVIFLEPAAWFLLWEGMDQVIFSSKKINLELKFYQKMSDARVHTHFYSY